MATAEPDEDPVDADVLDPSITATVVSLKVTVDVEDPSTSVTVILP